MWNPTNIKYNIEGNPFIIRFKTESTLSYVLKQEI